MAPFETAFSELLSFRPQGEIHWAKPCKIPPLGGMTPDGKSTLLGFLETSCRHSPNKSGARLARVGSGKWRSATATPGLVRYGGLGAQAVLGDFLVQRTPGDAEYARGLSDVAIAG